MAMDSAWTAPLGSVPQHLEVYHIVQHSAHTLPSLSSEAEEHPGWLLACLLKSLLYNKYYCKPELQQAALTAQ